MSGKVCYKVIPLISVVGKSRSGKTTLLAKVIKGLREKGIRVAIIKHAHKGFEMDYPGKDSRRLLDAGADVVAVSSQQKFALIRKANEEMPLSNILSLLEGEADIVITEGYKHAHNKKIEVLSGHETRTSRADELTAVISDNLTFDRLPSFKRDNGLRVVDFIVTLINNQVYLTEIQVFCRPLE